MAQEGAAELILRGRREQKAAFPPCVRAVLFWFGSEWRFFAAEISKNNAPSYEVHQICQYASRSAPGAPPSHGEGPPPLCAKRARGERAAHKIAFSFFLAGGGNVGGITTEVHRTKT